jgi:DedD protein
MKWAFWRHRKPRVTDPGRTDTQSGVRSDESGADEASLRAGPAAQVRARMRRRLIGAAALLLGTAVVVPMILDPAPKPLPDNIPIDIPSERTPFAPRLSLPAQTGQPAPPTPGREAEAGVAPATSEATTAPNAQKSGAGNSQPATAHGGAGNWFVQAAALSSESAARQLSERLSKAGLSPFVERTDTSDGVLYRVRLGPFSSREAAVKARKHLHALGVGSNVVRVEQAER